MNRLYFTYEPDENTGFIVAAKSHAEAKYIGHIAMGCEYTETRSRLVKGGDTFYDDMEKRDSGINITGNGTISVAFLEHKELDWGYFKELVVTMERGELFSNVDLEGESEKIVQLNTNVPPDRTCSVCGCTPDRACPGGCFWVKENLCSSCASECEEEDV
jgi:hypothetical protein